MCHIIILRLAPAPFPFPFNFCGGGGWGEEPHKNAKETARDAGDRGERNTPERRRVERAEGAPEAHWFTSPRNRSVRGSFKPPRAPRVRSGFAQRLIHHRRKKLPNPKGGKKPAPKARVWAKEPVASRRTGWLGKNQRRRICLFRI